MACFATGGRAVGTRVLHTILELAVMRIVVTDSAAAVLEAVQHQVTQLVHVSNLYYNVRQIELAELLGKQSNGMRSFFSNSGAEANEVAIKLARKFGRVHREGAFEVISMERSFH